MTQGAIVCEACGAKVRSTRTRCPRCRAVLAGPSEVRPSGPGAKIAGGVLAVAFIATVAILWRGDGTPEPTTSSTRPTDPLRRRAEPGAPVVAAAADVPPAPSFELASQLTPAPDSGDDAAALVRLQTALERDSQDVAALYNIGRVLLRLGRPREAVAPLKQALALKGDNWSYAFSYGYASALAERWPDAVSAFRAARVLMPNDAVTSYDLALSLQRVGDYAGAVQEYAAAIGLDSRAIPPRLGLAISLDRLGKAAEAVTAYEECLSLMEAGPDADRIRARVARLRE